MQDISQNPLNQSSASPALPAIDLIYKIESQQSEVDVFELARVLDSFGNVLKEGYRVAYPDQGELDVSVKPFERGSFVLDIALAVQQNPAYLFLATHPEVIEHAKMVLKFLGFVRDAKKEGVSLLDLLRGLKNGKPVSIEQKAPDQYEYTANDGSIMPVNSTVNALYQNSVINHYTYNIVAPLERDSVEGIVTYLKNNEESSTVKLSRDDAVAVRAFAMPPEVETKVEILEDVTTKILNPKSGNYGQTTGTWSFTIAGTKRVIKARISDKDFLTKYSNGTVRFYQGDRLKVHLRERQIVEGGKTKMEYEIVQVLEYSQARPLVRPTQLQSNS